MGECQPLAPCVHSDVLDCSLPDLLQTAPALSSGTHRCRPGRLQRRAGLTAPLPSLSLTCTSTAPAPVTTGAAPGIYSGVLDCFVKTFKADGPLAFYNGFTSNFARLGSWK